MSTRCSAEFSITAWEETPFDEATGVAKLTEALVEKTYTGDIEGSSATKWLMAYEPNKDATFIGFERIRGKIAGKRGSLVLQHVGRFESGVATAKLTVVSGTGQIRSVTGKGKLRADPAGSVTLDLEL